MTLCTEHNGIARSPQFKKKIKRFLNKPWWCYNRRKKKGRNYKMLLEGKVAIVTGGTRGIGFEIVRKYLENGAKVVLFGSRQDTVDKALAKLKEENPDWEAEGMFPKLTDASEVEKAILDVKEKFGKIDILVNNAGISQSTPLYDYTPEEFDKAIDLNVKALF